MPRNLQILVSPTAKPGTPAHWSLYTPSSTSPQIGKLIHVVGSPLHGYTLEFKASYEPEKDVIRRVSFPLGRMGDEYVYDVEFYEDDEGVRRRIVEGPRSYTDDVERVALGVEAPGRLKGWNPLVVPRAGDMDCQWWLRRYLEALVEEGIVAGEDLEKLEEVPKVW
ncbi:hypothetical protein ABW19_dt0202151 [Dactylella cylindrospora]|nr:hypothetical protein ABW19_dt0202151 [Dactylella cylindrospora]